MNIARFRLGASWSDSGICRVGMVAISDIETSLHGADVVDASGQSAASDPARRHQLLHIRYEVGFGESVSPVNLRNHW